VETDGKLVIWGDGAVGCGLAVAFSRYPGGLLLVGPPGSGRGRIVLEAAGAFPGKVTVEKAEDGDVFRGGPCILAVKAYHLGEVIDAVLDSSRGPCVCVCNGMGLERFWKGREDMMETAVLTAGFRKNGPFVVHTVGGALLAESGGAAEKLFGISRIPVHPVDSIEPARWAKWIVNGVINPLGALTGLRNDELLSAGLEDCVESLFRELVRAVPGKFREEARFMADAMLKELLASSANECSMLQDIKAGRPTEIDFLTGSADALSGGRRSLASFVSDLVRAVSRG